MVIFIVFGIRFYRKKVLSLREENMSEGYCDRSQKSMKTILKMVDIFDQ